MKRQISILMLAALWAVVPSRAQVRPPNEAGVSMGHLHLNVRDIDANRKFWIAMGGTAVPSDAFQMVKMPGVLIVLRQGEPTGGSVGSVVNHVGFQVQNIQESMAKWKAAGMKVEPGGRPEQCFVFTPDDLRIEILEEKSLTVPIQTHHIHFYVAESAVPEIQEWYAKTFGAKPGMRGQNKAADVPGESLTFSKSDTPTAPTKGRALDHIGFEIKNLEAFTKKLEAGGVKFDRPYAKIPAGLYIAFFTDPWGTYIELTEGLDRF